MLIPYDQLEADTLTRLIEDFVAPTTAMRPRWKPACYGCAMR
jgi:hypothetical protein